jgi:RimJ/RimL family protein N-acetyltransferase
MPSADPAFRFEPLRERDLTMLREWLERPHVAQWWLDPSTVEELREDYLSPAAAASGLRAYIVYQGDRAIGFIQSYVVMGSGDGWWADETDPGARGTDQFLANAGDLGQGRGSAMLRAFLAQLFADPAVTVVQTDPDPGNERAIRCYRRAGFRAVGIVATPDGPALLMRCPRPE